MKKFALLSFILCFLLPLASYGETSATLSLYSSEEEKLKVASLIKLKIDVLNSDNKDKWALSIDGESEWVNHGSILVNRYDLEGDREKSIIFKALILSDSEVFIPPIPIRREASDDIVETNNLVLKSAPRTSSNEKPKWILPLMQYGGWNTSMIVFVLISGLFILLLIVFYLKKWIFNKNKNLAIDNKAYAMEKLSALMEEVGRKANLNQKEVKGYAYRLINLTKVYLSEIIGQDLLDFTDREVTSFFLKNDAIKSKFLNIEQVFTDTYEVRYGSAYINKDHFFILMNKLKKIMDNEIDLENKKKK